jgi:nicotinamidase-related amidase
MKEKPMSVTTLDSKTALVVIDLQKGLLSFPTVHPIADVINQSAKLAAAFRRHNLPVVLVNATGGAPGRAEQGWRVGDLPADWADLVPELNAQAGDILITKRTWGAFTGTDLAERLKALDVTQVVVVGVATAFGVESTARHAHELGFNVTLPTDAMTDMSLDTHVNGVSRIFPMLGETGTTEEILALLESPRE